MIDDQRPQGGTTTQTVKLESDLLVRLKIHAAVTKQTQQDILHTALIEYLDRHEKGAAKPTKSKPKERVNVQLEMIRESSTFLKKDKE